MRVAIVSDVHGNRTALEAVLADLRLTAPDLILHGGDIADSGSSPVEVVDTIRSLGWPGVVGNTDEMLSTPTIFESYAAQLPALDSVWKLLREMAAFTRDRLGSDRLTWLRGLPQSNVSGSVALVHATLESRWRSPSAQASEDELTVVYETLPQPIVVYGHIHTPFVRRLNRPGREPTYVANSGSVGQSHDGDRRAAYLVLDDGLAPAIRRVDYDVDRELKALSDSGLPYAGWIRQIIQAASPQMP